MKKIIYLMSILLACSGSIYAQKSNVKLAKSRANALENPDFKGAREAINAALENPETKDLEETWEVAGQIGWLQYKNMEQNQFINGTPMDVVEAGKAISESAGYFIVADSLSLLPNAKGKVSDRKHRDFVEKMLEYYKSAILLNCGVKYFEEFKDYTTAYDYFEQHLGMRNLKMMQDPKIQEQMPNDTLYQEYRSYQAMFAIRAGQDIKAIAIYEELKNGQYKTVAINEWLADEYLKVGDTINYVRTLKEGVEKFPNEPYFIQFLINHYIHTDQVDVAIEYLDKAIERDPNNANYYQVKGSIYAILYDSDGSHRDDAIEALKKAESLDPNLFDVQYSLGNIYYIQGEKAANSAAYIQDNNQFKAAMAQAEEIFRIALPYFEKANQIKNDNRNTKQRLRSIYYRLKMDDKYEAMNAELNAL